MVSLSTDPVPRAALIGGDHASRSRTPPNHARALDPSTPRCVQWPAPDSLRAETERDFVLYVAVKVRASSTCSSCPGSRVRIERGSSTKLVAGDLAASSPASQLASQLAIPQQFTCVRCGTGTG